ncbi:unnamed protein product [Effrenium voratum]|nr:unnamed protein product [Effrenium voratum]
MTAAANPGLDRRHGTLAFLRRVKQRALSAKQLTGVLRQLSSGDVFTAFQVLKALELQGDVNQIHRNVVATAATRASRWQLALQLFNPKADVVGYSAAMDACVVGSLWRRALELFNLSRKLPPDIVMVSAAIDACDVGGHWQAALGFLRLMPDWRLCPNQITYTKLLRLLPWPTALALLFGHAPMGAVAFGAAVAACGAQNAWRAAVALLGAMPGHAAPNAAVFNAAIKAAAAEWRVAVALFGSMRQHDVPPNAITCTSLLHALGDDRWPRAVALLSEMRSLQVADNIISWNSLLHALSSSSSAPWQLAVASFAELRGRRLRPDSGTFAPLLRAMGGQWRRALALWAAIPEHQVEMDVLCCSAAMTACQNNWQVVLVLLDSLPSLSLAADATACTSAIASCGQCAQWQAALAVVSSMPERRVSANSITYAASVTALANAGCWSLVLQLVEEMAAQDLHSFSESKYDHTVQAGSLLDVFKHTVLVGLLQQMCADSEPMIFIDTHAGRGIYDLQVDEGPLNFQRGISQLLHADSAAAWGYRYAVARHASGARYPGSAALGAQWLRPQDSAMVFEISHRMCAELAHNLQHISAAHIDVVCGDSYRLLLQHRSLHGKGLILIDPPCDPYDLYMAWSLCLVKHVLKHWSGFSIIMWYPCLGQSQLQGLYSQAIALDVGDVLVAEFGTSGTVSLERSGVFIFAPSDEAEGWLHMQLQLLASATDASRKALRSRGVGGIIGSQSFPSRSLAGSGRRVS